MSALGQDLNLSVAGSCLLVKLCTVTTRGHLGGRWLAGMTLIMPCVTLKVPEWKLAGRLKWRVLIRGHHAGNPEIVVSVSPTEILPWSTAVGNIRWYHRDQICAVVRYEYLDGVTRRGDLRTGEDELFGCEVRVQQVDMRARNHESDRWASWTEATKGNGFVSFYTCTRVYTEDRGIVHYQVSANSGDCITLAPGVPFFNPVPTGPISYPYPLRHLSFLRFLDFLLCSINIAGHLQYLGCTPRTCLLPTWTTQRLSHRLWRPSSTAPSMSPGSWTMSSTLSPMPRAGRLS